MSVPAPSRSSLSDAVAARVDAAEVRDDGERVGALDVERVVERGGPGRRLALRRHDAAPERGPLDERRVALRPLAHHCHPLVAHGDEPLDRVADEGVAPEGVGVGAGDDGDAAGRRVRDGPQRGLEARVRDDAHVARRVVPGQHRRELRRLVVLVDEGLVAHARVPEDGEGRRRHGRLASGPGNLGEEAGHALTGDAATGDFPPRPRRERPAGVGGGATRGEGFEADEG